MRPRLWPLSLFSDEPLRQRLAGVLGPVRRPLVVISADPAGRCPVYARFTPGADASLRDHLLASCAIPLVFPPVNIEGRLLVDGGVPLGCPLDLSGLLEGEIVALCPVRPDEKLGWSPDDRARRTMLMFLEQARPAVTLYPSRRLDFTMLTFKAALLREAAELGERDATAFLNKL